MKTVKYGILRTISQMFALLIIACSSIMLAMAASIPSLSTVENMVTTEAIFSFYTFGLATCGINIILGLLVACGVTSGSKVIMTIYHKFNILCIFLNLGFTLYFKLLYKITFSTKLGSNSGISIGLRGVLTAQYNSVAIDEAVVQVKRDMIYIIDFYTITQCIVLCSSLFLYIITKVLLKIKLYKEESPRLPVVKMSKQGLNTESLRSWKVIEVVP